MLSRFAPEEAETGAEAASPAALHAPCANGAGAPPDRDRDALPAQPPSVPPAAQPPGVPPAARENEDEDEWESVCSEAPSEGSDASDASFVSFASVVAGPMAPRDPEAKDVAIAKVHQHSREVEADAEKSAFPSELGWTVEYLSIRRLDSNSTQSVSFRRFV